MSVSVVVPVYNSAGTLGELVARVDAALAGREYEVVFVNDGSRDGSWRRIVELTRHHEQVRALDLSRNYGQHNALLAGIRKSRGDVVVTIDDDLQNPPEEIPWLLAELDEHGLDVVYGTPRRKRHGFFRNLGTALAKRALAPVIGKEAARNVSAFRAFRSSLRDGFRAFDGPHVSIDALLAWSTTKIGALAVEHHERDEGRSSYTFRRLATHAITMLTAFSTRPLHAASLLGVVSMLFGVAVLVYVVTRYLIEGVVAPGFAFLASTIAIFSGIQLLTLGVIGEYLARMHERTMSRPTYIVREEVGTDVDEGERAVV